MAKSVRIQTEIPPPATMAKRLRSPRDRRTLLDARATEYEFDRQALSYAAELIGLSEGELDRLKEMANIESTPLIGGFGNGARE